MVKSRNENKLLKSDLDSLIEATVNRILKEVEDDAIETRTFYTIGAVHEGKISVEKYEFDSNDMEEEGFENMDEYENYLREESINELNQHFYEAITMNAKQIEELYKEFKRKELI